MSGESFTFKIIGHPIVLKNGKIPMIWNGKPVIMSNKQVKETRKDYLWQLKIQWIGKKPITAPVNMKILSRGAWFRKNNTIPDSSNLYEYPQDLFQEIRILENDRQVEHHDGCRRICLCDTCPEAPKGKRLCKGKKGSFKWYQPCKKEEIEIVLTVL